VNTVVNGAGIPPAIYDESMYRCAERGRESSLAVDVDDPIQPPLRRPFLWFDAEGIVLHAPCRLSHPADDSSLDAPTSSLDIVYGLSYGLATRNLIVAIV
jgi:hypothetical protein